MGWGGARKGSEFVTTILINLSKLFSIVFGDGGAEFLESNLDSRGAADILKLRILFDSVRRCEILL